MPIDLLHPDSVISLHPDLYAPRAARYWVRTVDSPSPDLRDAVLLLTSELVSRAAQQRQVDSDERIELRVWMPADVVRVELTGPHALFTVSQEHDDPRYELLLLDQLADRWLVETNPPTACIWFEIDRHGAEGQQRPDSRATRAA
jgi:hypothetical protein